MKKNILALMACLLPLTLWAQNQTVSAERQQSIYLELGGASTIVGINYDSRFSEFSHWGWRTGLSWGYSESSDFLDGDENTRAYAVPVEINYLLGNQHSHLELGMGVSLGIYNGHYQETEWQQIDAQTYEKIKDSPDVDVRGFENVSTGVMQYYQGTTYQHSRNVFGYYVFGNIGYRHTAKNGFQFRVGVSPSFNFGDSHGVQKPVLYPYISFGKAF